MDSEPRFIDLDNKKLLSDDEMLSADPSTKKTTVKRFMENMDRDLKIIDRINKVVSDIVDQEAVTKRELKFIIMSSLLQEKNVKYLNNLTGDNPDVEQLLHVELDPNVMKDLENIEGVEEIIRKKVINLRQNIKSQFEESPVKDHKLPVYVKDFNRLQTIDWTKYDSIETNVRLNEQQIIMLDDFLTGHKEIAAKILNINKFNIGKRMPKKGISCLGNVLKDLSNLQQIRLNFNHAIALDDQGLKEIGNAISQMKNLRTLEFNLLETQLSSMGFKELKSSIEKLGKIEDLSLEFKSNKEVEEELTPLDVIKKIIKILNDDFQNIEQSPLIKKTSCLDLMTDAMKKMNGLKALSLTVVSDHDDSSDDESAESVDEDEEKVIKEQKADEQNQNESIKVVEQEIKQDQQEEGKKKGGKKAQKRQLKRSDTLKARRREILKDLLLFDGFKIKGNSSKFGVQNIYSLDFIVSEPNLDTFLGLLIQHDKIEHIDILKIDHEQLDKVVTMLAKLPNLQSVRIDEKLGKENVEALLKLNNLKNLKKFDFEMAETEESVLWAIEKLQIPEIILDTDRWNYKIQNLEGLTELGLSYSYQGSMKGLFTEIIDDLHRMKNLKKLKLDLSGLIMEADDDEDFEALMMEVATLTQLRSFELNMSELQKRGLEDLTMKILGEAIAHLESLRFLKLNFSQNPAISDLGVRFITQSLLGIRHLENLNIDFSECRMASDSGIESLVEGCERITDLKQLSLSFSSWESDNITDIGIEHIIKLLIANPNMEDFKLRMIGYVGITDTGVRLMREALISMRHLKQTKVDFDASSAHDSTLELTNTELGGTLLISNSQQ